MASSGEKLTVHHVIFPKVAHRQNNKPSRRLVNYRGFHVPLPPNFHNDGSEGAIHTYNRGVPLLPLK